MYNWKFITLFGLIPTSARKNNVFIFNLNKKSFVECIENNLLNIDQSYEEKRMANIIAERSVKNFVKKM